MHLLMMGMYVYIIERYARQTELILDRHRELYLYVDCHSSGVLNSLKLTPTIKL